MENEHKNSDSFLDSTLRNNNWLKKDLVLGDGITVRMDISSPPSSYDRYVIMKWVWLIGYLGYASAIEEVHWIA